MLANIGKIKISSRMFVISMNNYDCWKVSLVVPVLKNIGERSTAKNYCPVSLLSEVSKVFEKLVNNKIVDHLREMWPFF